MGLGGAGWYSPRGGFFEIRSSNLIENKRENIGHIGHMQKTHAYRASAQYISRGKY